MATSRELRPVEVAPPGRRLDDPVAHQERRRPVPRAARPSDEPSGRAAP